MKILILMQYFQPEPFFKALPFAKALKARGHDVEVLTGFPNYPGGRVYEPYRVRPYQREIMDGVPVHRAALYPSHDLSALRRVANFASFALSASAVGALKLQRPDVIYAYHPPGTIAIPAAALKARFRTRLVYDVQDVWPDSVVASGMAGGSAVRAGLNALSSFTYRVADRLVVLGPRMKELLVERGAALEKVDVIYNWSDESQPIPSIEAAAAARAKAGWSPEDFVVLFAGNMGPLQGLDTVLEAASLLQSRNARVRFAFLGSGIAVDGLKATVEASGLRNVQFLPRVPASEVGQFLGAADALLVHLKPTPMLDTTIPSKTQAYMRAGRPLIMAGGGDGADLVTRAQCGVTARPGHTAGIAAATEELASKTRAELDAIGAAGQAFYERELSLAEGTRRFEAVFENVSARPRH